MTGIRSWIGRMSSFGAAGDDRAAVEDLVAALPRQLRPDPREREQLSVGAAEPNGPFAALVGQPLVEAVGGDQAPARGETTRRNAGWL